MTALLSPQSPAAAPCETSRTQQAWRAYDAAASEEELLKSHLPLVRSVVDRMRASLPAHVEAEDLYSVGLVGLVHAARKFDPSLGVSFAGFAVTRIRGAVLDELRRMDWMSRSVRGKAKKLTDAIAEVEQRLGRPVSEAEMAEELSMTPEQYAALLDEVRPVSYVALDDTAMEGEGSLHEIIADESQVTASEETMKREMVRLVVERMQQMPDIQKKVLAMYYFENLRLAEIAAAFGLTESRICQIHSQAVLSLRTYTKSVLSR
jgi:RNA polymerase sigma factor for flagellar operon FliA